MCESLIPTYNAVGECQIKKVGNHSSRFTRSQIYCTVTYAQLLKSPCVSNMLSSPLQRDCLNQCMLFSELYHIRPSELPSTGFTAS